MASRKKADPKATAFIEQLKTDLNVRMDELHSALLSVAEATDENFERAESAINNNGAVLRATQSGLVDARVKQGATAAQIAALRDSVDKLSLRVGNLAERVDFYRDLHRTLSAKFHDHVRPKPTRWERFKGWLGLY